MMDNSAHNSSTPSSVWDRLSDATLKYSGYAYLVGDGALFAYGMSKREYGSAFTGLSWGLGGLALALFGKQNERYQLQRLTQDLGRHLQSQGVHLPSGSQLSRITAHSREMIPQLERFMYDHPSQVLNSVYAVGSIGVLRSGLQKGDRWQAASGALVGSGALAGLLIPEKEKTTDEPESAISPFTDPVGWVREKPLRLSGLLYSLNNVTMAKSGWNEMRTAPHDKRYWYKFATVGSYTAANSLLALSSKDRDADKAILNIDKLLDIAAKAINVQESASQPFMLNETVAYLAASPNVARDAEALKEALLKRLPSLKKQEGVQVATIRHHGRLDETSALAQCV